MQCQVENEIGEAKIKVQGKRGRKKQSKSKKVWNLCLESRGGGWTRFWVWRGIGAWKNFWGLQGCSANSVWSENLCLKTVTDTVGSHPLPFPLSVEKYRSTSLPLWWLREQTEYRLGHRKLKGQLVGHRGGGSIYFSCRSRHGWSWRYRAGEWCWCWFWHRSRSGKLW
jgi:hypothetical protein